MAKFELENGGHDISDYIAYITVGTGVGVGFVINGKCIHGLIHPEGGHVTVPRLPQEDKYNFKGVCPFHDSCVEGFCTNVAIAKRLGLKSVDEVPSIPDDHEVWDMVGCYLGTMCANLSLTISVEKIVIGGGVMNRGEVLFSKIRHHFLQRINKYLKHDKLNADRLSNFIVRSKFENDLGLISTCAVGSTATEWSKQGIVFSEEPFNPKPVINERERTFIMLKPDGVQRGMIGQIISQFEKKGFKLVAAKMVQPGKERFEQHYADLAGKKFFPGLVEYASSGPVFCMVWEGTNAVKTGRKMLGETRPFDSSPGTLRGNNCIDVGRNVIHGSDSVESANKEIELWFEPSELL